MVVFLELDTDDDEPGQFTLPHHHHGWFDERQHHRLNPTTTADTETHHWKATPTVSENTANSPTAAHCGAQDDNDQTRDGELFASALACYPAALSMASHLDLNDLDALSKTCRRIHQCLTQFAHHLRMHSLHCVNDTSMSSPQNDQDLKNASDDLGEGMQEEFDTIIHQNGPAFLLPPSLEDNLFHGASQSTLGLSGRVSRCAHDLVAPCRRCGVVVCRNCAAKPPVGTRLLRGRFRRLCRTCLDAPLSHHLHQVRRGSDTQHDSEPASSASSTRSARSGSSLSSQSQQESSEALAAEPAFTSSAFTRSPCHCASKGVFLCQPCGQNLHSSDTTYQRVWTWRSRYSTHIGGGLGTGLGLGNQGQKCGRGEDCLEKGSGGVCWVEIECSETRTHKMYHDEAHGLPNDSEQSYARKAHGINKPGYLSQEMEGIGGVVKKKVKKRVKVGATVYEFDDERESGQYLEREASGRERSWCGWCSRLTPGLRDLTELKQVLRL